MNDHTLFIYLDDVRPAPDDGMSWNVFRRLNELYDFLADPDTRMGQYNKVVFSLDHDLGDDQPTGYDFLNVFEKTIAEQGKPTQEIEFRIHSANPVGRQNMEAAIRSIYRMLAV